MTDHNHVINKAIEKFAEYNKPLYMTFLHYEKAFDSVYTAAVLQALKDQGIEKIYIRLQADTYKACTGRTILHKKYEKIPIRNGVQQGISPKVFTSCLENIFRKLKWEQVELWVN